MPNRSTFPTAIDSFVNYVELSPSDAVSANRWKALKALPDKSEEQIAEYNALTEQLSNKIISSEAFNRLCDCIVALETFFRDNTAGYLDELKEQFTGDMATNGQLLQNGSVPVEKLTAALQTMINTASAHAGATGNPHGLKLSDLGGAPASHASSATTYGVGTTTNYGHVKVTGGNGLAIGSGAISMGAASASAAGAVTTGAQSFAGDKTFNGTVVVANPAVGTKAARRVYAGTGGMDAGSTALDTGTIYCQYE